MASAKYLIVLIGCLTLARAAKRETHNFHKVCGLENPNHNFIDLSEPLEPGPFHDLTTNELERLKTFLESNPDRQLSKPENANSSGSILLAADLHLPPKQDILKFLESKGQQPERWARVVIFKGETIPHTVKELVCGPLPNVEKCELLNLKYRQSLINTLKGIPKASLKYSGRKEATSADQIRETLRSEQRAPLQVEPDGKRYTIKNQEVQYLDWSFSFRVSPMTGPALYNVKFKGDRIAYEISLSQIAIQHSVQGADLPSDSVTDTDDDLSHGGVQSKSLVVGGDCPEYSTLIDQTVLRYDQTETRKSALCLFEVNNGHPLRRHLSYNKDEGGFYGGLLDSVLTLRAGVSRGNYEYVLDFTFHQNGIIETRLMNTDLDSVPLTSERNQPIYEIHHHLAHFKVDLDIAGPINRYKTLNVVKEAIPLRQNLSVLHYQTRVEQEMKSTELEAVYDSNFNNTKYLIVYSEDSKTVYGENRGYRILLNAMTKQLLPQGKESTIPWSEHQMVVTKHSDDEVSSSSMLSMFDVTNPAVDFNQFFKDNDNIVDEDLVFWITQGMYHIVSSEDRPATTTVGNQMTFFLLPYNYFSECPSMGSRDSLYVTYKDRNNIKLGLTVDRGDNSREPCVLPPTSSGNLLKLDLGLGKWF
ncbi:putative amine oxidase [copper-containing] [Biomphalaria glabrata]|uniref:Amine oxidase n=1 Tax=Biomphalaria glabrata TaxID=6526 RepID=A0A9W3BPR3_BIOGL|nr:putative amine oxidase [copper-containing] [Biomphalaria glabrata]